MSRNTEIFSKKIEDNKKYGYPDVYLRLIERQVYDKKGKAKIIYTVAKNNCIQSNHDKYEEAVMVYNNIARQSYPIKGATK